MATYQGHKNWNHWNVSWWLNNDEMLYDLARRALRKNRNKSSRSQDLDRAAEMVLQELQFLGLNKTPDGARYTKEAIWAALADFE